MSKSVYDGRKMSPFHPEPEELFIGKPIHLDLLRHQPFITSKTKKDMIEKALEFLKARGIQEKRSIEIIAEVLGRHPNTIRFHISRHEKFTSLSPEQQTKIHPPGRCPILKQEDEKKNSRIHQTESLFKYFDNSR